MNGYSKNLIPAPPFSFFHFSFGSTRHCVDIHPYPCLYQGPCAPFVEIDANIRPSDGTSSS